MANGHTLNWFPTCFCLIYTATQTSYVHLPIVNIVCTDWSFLFQKIISAFKIIILKNKCLQMQLFYICWEFTQFLTCIADVFFLFQAERSNKEVSMWASKQASLRWTKNGEGVGRKVFSLAFIPRSAPFYFAQFHSLHMPSSKNLLCRLLKFWSVLKFDTSLLTQPKFHNPSVSVLTGLHCIILTLQLQLILTCFPSLLATLPFYRLHERFFTL